MDQAKDLDITPGQYVDVMIVDNGPGIPREILKRVLDPFFTTKGGKGTGLGLCIAHGIARQSGGTLYIESIVGVGTSVHILLPRIEAPDASEVPTEGQAIPPTSMRAYKVLLVDDNQDVAESLRESLAASGLAVTLAFSADDALALLASTDFDVLVTDVMMPGTMDGIELAQRATERRPDLRILLISGHLDPERAEELNGFTLLYKPCTSGALIASIDTLFTES